MHHIVSLVGLQIEERGYVMDDQIIERLSHVVSEAYGTLVDDLLRPFYESYA